jgi:UDP-GlcNAc:undecaprenyl-phosphate GlcNAc-1-phosphate transferase
VSVTGAINPGATDKSTLFPAFIPILLPLAILIVPLLDFSLAVLRRVGAGKSPFSADRKHLHHRLLDMGHSHFHAVLIFYGWTSVVSVGCLLFVFLPARLVVVFLAVGLVVCTVLTLAPLSRRKRVEIAVQSAPSASAATAGVEQYDPLDQAGRRVSASAKPSREDERQAVTALRSVTGPSPTIPEGAQRPDAAAGDKAKTLSDPSGPRKESERHA